MPRYLAFDYLSDALCQRQAHLSRLRIICPPHVVHGRSRRWPEQSVFLYREPWKKGFSPQFDCDAVQEELQNAVNQLSKKQYRHNEDFLKLCGVKYSFSGGMMEEIVPSSDPNSEATLQSSSQNANPNIQCKSNFSVRFVTELADNICSENSRCLEILKYSVEPILMATHVANCLVVVDDLIKRLSFIDVPDPSEEASLVAADIDSMEKCLQHSVIKLNPVNSPVDYNVYSHAMPCTKCLDSDYISYGCSIPTIPCFPDTKPEDVYEAHDQLKQLGVNALCIRDIIDIQNGSGLISAEKDIVSSIEALDKKYTTYQDLSNFYINSQGMELTFEEFLPSNDVDEFQNDVQTVVNTLSGEGHQDELIFENGAKYATALMRVEQLPTIPGAYHLSEVLLSEPDLVQLQQADSHWQPMWFPLEVKPEIISDETDNSLHWDPIKHASFQLFNTKLLLNREHLVVDVPSSSRQHFGLEEFTPLELNVSFENIAEISSATITTEISYCADIPSVKKNFPKNHSMQPSLPSTEVNKSPAQELQQPKDSSLSDSSMKLCLLRHSSDISLHDKCDLSTFMTLFGKRNLEHVGTPQPLVMDGQRRVPKCVGAMGIKRLRLAKVQGNDDKLTVERSSDMMLEDVNVHGKHAQLSLPNSEVDSKRYKKIEVCITGHFLDMACMLERETKPLLHDLQQNKLIPAGCSLSTVTRDYSRFIVKQQRKLVMDEGTANVTTNQVRLSLVEIFHQLVSVYYLLVHVSGVSALALLHVTIQDVIHSAYFKSPSVSRFHSMLSAIMTDLKYRMTVTEDTTEKEVVHPKIVHLKTLLESFHEHQLKKRRKAMKALIICCTKCRYLFSLLCKEVGRHSASSSGCLNALAANVETIELRASDVVQIYERDQLNVLIIAEQMISQEFPWHVFDLIVEYEHSDGSPWKDMCIKYGLDCTSLLAVLPQAGSSLDINTSEPHGQSLNAFGCLQSDDKCEQFYVIGSMKVMSLGKILHLLEVRHNILILEKDFSQFPELETSQPDIVLNETSCILLESFDIIASANAGEKVKDALARLTRLQRMYTSCCILIYSAHEDLTADKRFIFSGATPANLAKLQATLRQFSAATNDFHVYAMCCFTIEELAETVKDLTKQAYSSSCLANEDNLADGSWLSSHTTDAERFLLSLPCVNPFVAQLFLHLCHLKDSCGMSMKTFTEQMPWLRQRIVQDMYRCLHTSFAEERHVDIPGVQQCKPCADTDENVTPVTQSGSEAISQQKNRGSMLVKPCLYREKYYNSADQTCSVNQSASADFTDTYKTTHCNSNFAEKPCAYIQTPIFKQALCDENSVSYSERTMRRIRDSDDVDQLLHVAKAKLEEFVTRNPQRRNITSSDVTSATLHGGSKQRFACQQVKNISFGTLRESPANCNKIYNRFSNQNGSSRPWRSAGDFAAGERDRDPNGTSGSVNIGIAQPFQLATHGRSSFAKGASMKMTPQVKRKMLTYEKIPGSKGGQTRLTFF